MRGKERKRGDSSRERREGDEEETERERKRKREEEGKIEGHTPLTSNDLKYKSYCKHRIAQHFRFEVGHNAQHK